MTECTACGVKEPPSFTDESPCAVCSQAHIEYWQARALKAEAERDAAMLAHAKCESWWPHDVHAALREFYPEHADRLLTKGDT